MKKFNLFLIIGFCCLFMGCFMLFSAITTADYIPFLLFVSGWFVTIISIYLILEALKNLNEF